MKQDTLLGGQSYWEGSDFTPPLLSSKAWLNGKPPYDQEAIFAEATTNFGSNRAERYRSVYSPYPPTAFPALLPIAWLPARGAIAAGVTLTFAFYFCAIWLLGSYLKGSARCLFLAFAFNFAPFHSDIHERNIGAIACSLLMISAVPRYRESRLRGGALMGLAVAIKPQLGILFLLQSALVKQWRRVFFSLAAFSAIAFFALGWMMVHGVQWVDQYRTMIHSHFGPGADNWDTITFNGAPNFGLINLSPLIYTFSHNMSVATSLPYLISAALLVWYAASLRRNCADEESQLLSFGTLGSLTLLAFYNRYYSSILLLPAFVWLWQQWHRRALRALLVFGGILFSFPAPVDIAKALWAGSGKAPGQVTLGLGLLYGLPNLFVLVISILMIRELWLKKSNPTRSSSDRLTRPTESVVPPAIHPPAGQML